MKLRRPALFQIPHQLAVTTFGLAALLAFGPLAAQKSGVKNVDQFMTLVKANPGKFS